MENHDLPDIYGHATYMTQLADQYALSQHWASITNPSQPNYIAYIGGSTFGVGGDGNHPNLNHPTLVDIIENSGHTWKAFAEDASGSGCGLRPPRGEDHFPFLSYTTITGNPSRCAKLLPGTGSDVISAFNAGTNFIWLTPNDCNNMHSCSVSTGDSYLKGWVPNLLSAMAGKKAALFITYDEGYRNPPLVYSGFSGPSVKLAYKSTASYSHYSLIKLIEDEWGGGNLGQGDVNAPTPLEFFTGGGGPPPPPPPPPEPGSPRPGWTSSGRGITSRGRPSRRLDTSRRNPMVRTAQTWCSMGRLRIRSTSGRSSRATRRTKLPRVPSSRSRSSPVPRPRRLPRLHLLRPRGIRSRASPSTRRRRM